MFLLEGQESIVSVELRPPRAELDAAAGMDAWIDTYHSVTGLVRDGMPVFLTDSAVGAREENNLRHLVINLGSDVPVLPAYFHYGRKVIGIGPVFVLGEDMPADIARIRDWFRGVSKGKRHDA